MLAAACRTENVLVESPGIITQFCHSSQVLTEEIRLIFSVTVDYYSFFIPFFNTNPNICINILVSLSDCSLMIIYSTVFDSVAVNFDPTLPLWSTDILEMSVSNKNYNL